MPCQSGNPGKTLATFNKVTPIVLMGMLKEGIQNKIKQPKKKKHHTAPHRTSSCKGTAFSVRYRIPTEYFTVMHTDPPASHTRVQLPPLFTN